MEYPTRSAQIAGPAINPKLKINSLNCPAGAKAAPSLLVPSPISNPSNQIPLRTQSGGGGRERPLCPDWRLHCPTCYICLKEPWGGGGRGIKNSPLTWAEVDVFDFSHCLHKLLVPLSESPSAKDPTKQKQRLWKYELQTSIIKFIFSKAFKSKGNSRHITE